ncbi:MAG: glycosyltransferase [Methanosphaera sp.]|nr:glycosyltransferase [Methanosphaera sp.]
MVTVSIIMPVYNAEEYLERAINSAVKQTLKDIELICVNDGSTDKSGEILNKYSEKYDFIKIFNIENSGSGFARNIGIEKALGEYIAFLDADDEFIDANALEKMYAYGSKNDADMIGANLQKVTESGKIENNFNYSVGNYAYFSQKECIDPMDYGIPWAFYKNIYKRNFINEHDIKFPNLLRGQDPVFLSEVLINVDEIYGVKTDLYGYHYQVAGGPDEKINTYEKKYDYLQHFKQSFDLLNSGNFISTCENFKAIFINFLKIKNNYDDEDIKAIIPQVFDNLSDYFDENSYEYMFIKQVIGEDEELNKFNEEINDFKALKKELFEETLISDNFIEYEKLKEYITVRNEHENNNTELRLLSFESLKDIEKEVNKDYDYISEEIDGINAEIAKLNESNDAILSSNSWKATDFLRKIRHLYKK